MIRVSGEHTKLVLMPLPDYREDLYYPFPSYVAVRYLGVKYGADEIHGKFYATLGNRKIHLIGEVLKKTHLQIYTLFNYSGGLEAFDSIEFETVLTTGPKIFKDKIVLIGITGDTLGDRHATPISDDTPGVVIHANAIQSLIDGRTIDEMSVNRMAAITFTLSLAAFFALYFAPKWAGLSIAILLPVAFKIFTDVMFYRYRVYVCIAPFVVSLVFICVGAYISGIVLHEDKSVPAGE